MRPLNVFVSIPNGYRALLENAIKPLEGGRLHVVSFFERGSSGPFATSIRNHIALSNAVIAILTGGNENVLYEVGLALGNNRPVIVVTTDAIALPSMIRHLNAVIYDSSVPDWRRLHAELAERCQAILHCHYGPLRSRTHNEILVRQRSERVKTVAEFGAGTSDDPIELAINSYEEGNYDAVIEYLCWLSRYSVIPPIDLLGFSHSRNS
jgi:hypothetical protein